MLSGERNELKIKGKLTLIGPLFNVGKVTVIEAVQDVVEALYEIRNEYIKFPES